MRFSFSNCLLLIIFTFGLYSCSSTKYIPEGEYLLDKVYIKSDNKDYGSIELRPYVKQLPNYKMFGFNKTQLQIYNLSGKNDKKWLNRQLKRMGEPPVVFDSTAVERTSNEFRKFFVNKGYINVDVESQINRHGKKADVTYLVKSNEPYRIRNYDVEIQDSAIQEELLTKNNIQPRRLWGESTGTSTALVKPGMLFDRNNLDTERDRITNYLRNRGYYAFEKDYISYDADSALMSNSVDLKLNLHLYPEILPNGMFAEIPHHKYYLDSVFIYMDYDPLLAGEKKYLPSDTIKKGFYTIYYTGKAPSIRPNVLISNNFLTPERPYSQAREDITYSAYSSLQALNNVGIHYEEFFRNDSAFLNTHITAMPAKKQTVSVSLEGTNSEGDLGFASSLGYSHKNLLKGSETFNIKLRGAYESITDNFSAYYLDLGTETSITVPKFMFPFLNNSFKRRIRASTEFALSYNYQTRPEYDRTILSGGIRYLWQGRGNKQARHQFSLVDLNYVFLPNGLDSTFQANLPPSAIWFSYTNQFIMGMGYSYTVSTYNPMQKQRDVYSFKGSVESAGNLLYGLSSMTKANRDDNGYYKLFDIYYAQYIKADVDYSKTIIIDKQNSIAWRIGGGIGVPYGNSEVLPFEKRYYSGGANSVRAWSVRTLGPGGYVPIADTTTIYEQSGDIRLDLNIEYRSRFFWKLETAAFIDAGNIWTIKNYEKQDKGKFEFDSFYKQIAVGYGLGLRLDFDFFLIRLDWGWKAYDPSKSGSKKWAILKPNFRDNFAWHFAVGYPF